MRPHRPRGRALSLLALLLGVALALAGCGGDTKAKAQQKSPTEVMAQAKKLFDQASSVHLQLTTASTPPAGADGVLGASGDLTHDPAFEGTVKVLIRGVTATVPVTSVGGKVYAKLPFTTGYRTLDPAEFGAPDPADFADTTTGLSSLLTELKGLKAGSKTRNGDQILTSYAGSLPGAAVKKIIPSANAKETYETTVGVDDQGYARTVKITGIFFTGNQDVTYKVKLGSYGKSVKITTPTA